jgi:hypothetical protein
MNMQVISNEDFARGHATSLRRPAQTVGTHRQIVSAKQNFLHFAFRADSGAAHKKAPHLAGLKVLRGIGGLVPRLSGTAPCRVHGAIP